MYEIYVWKKYCSIPLVKPRNDVCSPISDSNEFHSAIIVWKWSTWNNPWNTGSVQNIPHVYSVTPMAHAALNNCFYWLGENHYGTYTASLFFYFFIRNSTRGKSAGEYSWDGKSNRRYVYKKNATQAAGHPSALWLVLEYTDPIPTTGIPK